MNMGCLRLMLLCDEECRQVFNGECLHLLKNVGDWLRMLVRDGV